MISFKKFSEEVKGDQLVHHGEVTKHFDICPSALKAFNQNQKKGMGDKDGFHEAVVAVDKYLGHEKMLAKKGKASADEVKRMMTLVADAKAKIKAAGLPGHDYHSIHTDKVKNLAKGVKENYLYDYGTPESVKLMKKITPGQSQKEAIGGPSLAGLSRAARSAEERGETGLAHKFRMEYEHERQKRDAQKAAGIKSPIRRN